MNTMSGTLTCDSLVSPPSLTSCWLCTVRPENLAAATEETWGVSPLSREMRSSSWCSSSLSRLGEGVSGQAAGGGRGRRDYFLSTLQAVKLQLNFKALMKACLCMMDNVQVLCWYCPCESDVSDILPLQHRNVPESLCPWCCFALTPAHTGTCIQHIINIYEM